MGSRKFSLDAIRVEYHCPFSPSIRAIRCHGADMIRHVAAKVLHGPGIKTHALLHFRQYCQSGIQDCSAPDSIHGLFNVIRFIRTVKPDHGRKTLQV